MHQVLHGWGQHLAFEGELRSYVAAVGHEPAIVSDYMDLLLVDGPTPEWEQECRRRLERGDDALAKGLQFTGQIAQLVESLNTTPARFAEFRTRTRKAYLPLIGVMWWGSNDEAIAAGRHDREICRLAGQVKACGFTVYLRPGFEFGPYGCMEAMTGMVSRKHYVAMFRRFARFFREQGAGNVQWVWNAVGVESFDYWMDYYPGDECVDWFGINLFSRRQIDGSGRFLEEAARRGKPVMICESAPALEGGTSHPDVRERFFVPYFRLIADHAQIQAFVYINMDWSALPGGPFQDWPDSRVQSSPAALEAYRQALAGPLFVHMAPAGAEIPSTKYQGPS